jgi:hypothetical protein
MGFRDLYREMPGTTTCRVNQNAMAGLQAKGAEKALLEDWGLALQELEGKAIYSGRPGRKPAKLVHNLMFSMPKETPPDKLLAAVRHFAQETFALQHRYAMVLHTDQDHPHVHLVLKSVSEQGTRLTSARKHCDNGGVISQRRYVPRVSLPMRRSGRCGE